MRQHYFCLTCGLDFCGRTAANGVIRAEDKGPTLANVPTPAYCIECAAKERNLLQRYPIDPTVLPRNLKPIHKPQSFGGCNFMTPTPIGYFSRALRGRTAHVEISCGSGFATDSMLYGVTFRWANGRELWRDIGAKDPSTCFHSLAQALEHAAGAS